MHASKSKPKFRFARPFPENMAECTIDQYLAGLGFAINLKVAFVMDSCYYLTRYLSLWAKQPIPFLFRYFLPQTE